MQHPPYNNSQSGQFQPPPFYNQPTQNKQGQFQPPAYPQYPNPQYYYSQPQPPRIPGRGPNQSGFKRLMLRRIPVPLWVIIVSIFIVLGLLSDVVTFASTHPISDTINSLDGQTPTPITSIQTATPTLVPTPTPTPNADQKRIALDAVDCATRSYIPSYNSAHTQLTIVAASNDKKWLNTQDATEGGKAVAFCLEKFIWASQPNLQLVAVLVMGMLPNGNILYMGASLNSNTVIAFNWNLTPDQAWSKYDDRSIKS